MMSLKHAFLFLSYLMLFTISYLHLYLTSYFRLTSTEDILLMNFITSLLLGLFISNILHALLTLILSQILSLLLGSLLVSYPIMSLHTSLSYIVALSFIRKSIPILFIMILPPSFLFTFLGSIFAEYLHLE